MPIHGPRPRLGGPGEVNLGMYHDRPRASVGYAGGGGEIPNFETFWNATGRKMFGTPAIHMARGGPVNQSQIERELDKLHYADMPLGGPLAGPGPMAPIVPGDLRTDEMKRQHYADMPLGGPMARGGPVKTGYARGGPVRYDQYGAPIREEDSVSPSTAPTWSPEQHKMAMYELGEGYAAGGAVIPREYSGYRPISSDPVARRRYNPRRTGYAEGGDVDQQAGPDIAGYVSGANAMDPQELEQILQQIAQLDPNQNEDAVNLTAIVQAAQSGDMEQASSILSGFRKRFDSLNAHAQGAAAHGDLAAAAQLAGKAHSQVPDGIQVSYTVGEDGSVTATITPSGQTFTMSGQQFHDYLVGPGTGFDHLLENGLAKNLSIASGSQGAAPPTGYAAGNGADPLGLLPSAPAAPTAATPPEQPPGYAEGGEVIDDDEERRQREQQARDEAQQLVRDVLERTRQDHGLVAPASAPAAGDGVWSQIKRGLGFGDEAAPASSRRGTTRAEPVTAEEPRLGARPLPGPASSRGGVQYPEQIPGEGIIIPPERVPGMPPTSARSGAGRRLETDAPEPQRLGSREDISLPAEASPTAGQTAAPVSSKQAAYDAAYKAAADRGDIYTTPRWSLDRLTKEAIPDIMKGQLFGRKNTVDYSEADRQFPPADGRTTDEAGNRYIPTSNGQRIVVDPDGNQLGVLDAQGNRIRDAKGNPIRTYTGPQGEERTGPNTAVADPNQRRTDVVPRSDAQRGEDRMDGYDAPGMEPFYGLKSTTDTRTGEYIENPAYTKYERDRLKTPEELDRFVERRRQQYLEEHGRAPPSSAGQSGQPTLFIGEPTPPNIRQLEPPLRIQTRQGPREVANPANAGIQENNRREQHRYDTELRQQQQIRQAAAAAERELSSEGRTMLTRINYKQNRGEDLTPAEQQFVKAFEGRVYRKFGVDPNQQPPEQPGFFQRLFGGGGGGQQPPTQQQQQPQGGGATKVINGVTYVHDGRGWRPQ